MTYLLNGVQYFVIAVSGAGHAGKLIASRVSAGG
jgi:hypothetical protein